MIDVFHGNNSETHQRFQAWRKANVDGFHMTESAALQFTIHYAQDKRENAAGRGCNHQGGSDIEYLEDKDGCYTTARKVCSNSLAELIAWATDRSLATKNCKHCNTKRFPFQTVVSQVVGLAEGSVAGVTHFVSYHSAEKMGYSFEQAEPFSVGTSKSVERLRGERVWSISGEGRPRRYHLRNTWVVDDVGESSQDEFSNYARGRGVEFTPPIPISDLPWFSAFLKSQSNFSLGLQHIKDVFVPHFDALLAGRATPASVQAAGNVRGPLPVVDQSTLTSAATGPAERIISTVSRIVRDTLLACRIKALHNHECQLCGHTIVMPDGSRYAEGHHIQPLGTPHDGPDTAANVLCLCPNHHAACDKGAIALTMDELRKADGHDVGQEFLDYHNRIVRM